MTSKHIALLKSRFQSRGGLEKYALRIAKAFAAKGAKVSILTTQTSFPELGTAIEFFPFHTSIWPAFLRMEQFDLAVRKWLKNHPVDLIFGMDRNRFQTHIRAGNGVHLAYLQSRLHAEGSLKHLLCKFNPMHRKILALEKCAFENPSLQKLFTNSYMVKKQVLSHYKTDPKKIEVIHNGVEWKEMESDFLNWKERKKILSEKFSLDPNHFHFLFIGHGYLRKGLDLLLEALSRLSCKEAHLSVVGKENQISFYREKAQSLGLAKQVHFFGAQKEIRPFYQLADALVIPSFYDPFANVTVEALAMGLFVVSSKENGGHEIVTPESGALIENLQDPDSFVAAMQKALLQKKTEKSSHLIRNSVEKLDFSHQLKKLIDACE